MRALLALIGFVALVVAGAMALGLVSITRTRDARLPDVALKGGQAPAFRAEIANVQVGRETRTITVPELEMRKRQVEVPAVKVRKPDDGDRRDRD